ncbi:recombinase family protein [Melghirimyces algeriensis]|uniref:Site-specific DNA recombinase n=1 Tax=Melghirimyces algeriensis TaxID=910412 RepID=A0A521CBZ3_9BACL|nr:recombinase family protein [Melghirimyces algeriensis]SMO56914.1 Site-specific DNA recombinase [Melghirimyces algeriensis]
MNQPSGLDVFMYLRKSRTDIEEERRAQEEGLSFDVLKRHRKQLLDLANQKQHRILEIYEEIVSGEHLFDRPQIQKMLKSVEKGACDAVLVMDLDRLGRGDLYDMGIIFRAFRLSETYIITPYEVIYPSEEGAELLFGVKSIISREELKSITKRMQRGRRASASEGKSITSKVPFGYWRDANLKLHPDPDTAWVVQQIFEMVARGKGRNQIANELTNLGIRTPGKGREWSHTMISKILKNEVYLGHIVWGKNKYIKQNGKYISKPLPPEQWYRKEHAHKPIITQELWDLAHQNYGMHNPPRVKSSQKLVNPLAGLVYCKNCGYALTRKADSKNTAILRCPSIRCRGIVKGISLQLIESRILDSIKEFTQAFTLDIQLSDKFPTEIPLKKKSLKVKEKQLGILQEQHENLHDLLEQGTYDAKTFADRQKKLSDRIRKVKEQIKKLRKEINREEQNCAVFKPKVKTISEAYDVANDAEKKNRLLKSVLDRIEYSRQQGSKHGEFTINIFFRI